MFVGTPVGSNPTSPIPAQSPSSDCGLGSHFPDFLPQSPLCWATQTCFNLAQTEAELHRLQELHATKIESVKQGLERAIQGARREEQRLLERVEQDHRDTQQNLEQVLRENMAAAQVTQSLLDQRLQKLALLQKQIQEVGQDSHISQSESNHTVLLKEVAEFLQPWEISVSLKKVNFKPSSQPNAVTFGDIHVQEQSLCLHVGGCGPQGQLCALHSQEMQYVDTSQNGSGEEQNILGQGWTSPTGRVFRKISLSTRADGETESTSFEPQREDVFLAVSSVVKNMDTEGKQHLYRTHSNEKPYSPRNQRKPLTGASGRKLSLSSEPRQEHAKLGNCMSLDNQKGNKGKVNKDSISKHFKYSNSSLTSSRMTSKEHLTSQSCLDLTSRGRPHSCPSQSFNEYSLETLGDSGRTPSPTESLDSSYTFIISPSQDYGMKRGSLNYNCLLSKSAVDLTYKTRPIIGSGMNEHVGVCRGKCKNSMSTSTSTLSTLNRGLKFSDMGQTLLHPIHQGHNGLHWTQKKITASNSKQPLVGRSLSLSITDGSSQEPKRGTEKRRGRVLVELEEKGHPSFAVFNPRGVHLIRQFGKQGSGRADLTLPSGIHATPQGQLFIVDCGNARVQITDPLGNVLQQVTSTSDDSGRRCRNYFDIAVNAKGLIAISCAAERALLVFNRHGRLLQTFGRSGLGSAKDELEAPRGVTVTRLDEFLVADIRKGTLIALKLDPKTGSRLERTVVTGFHQPYLVVACLNSGMIAVSERGNETGHVPCIKVLDPSWNTVRILGVCAGMGPVLICPWGICIDTDGSVLVADWGDQHRVLLYPAQGVGQPIITQGLSSPRGLTLLPDGHLTVSDSMHHCIKIYQYKATQA